jgi:tRNA-2-methylthio-N6-dimethylallyladenosine synthase
LQQLHDALPDLPRLRFLTSFPADFGDDILEVMAACPRICKYLHVPGQSGSNRILKMMNRGYTIESYLELLDRARRIVPGIIFAGDVIVGFPTETDEDYQATRRMVQAARYKNCYIFKYSARPGTVAIKRYEDDVPDDVKRQRNNDLLKIQNDICTEINRELIGKTVDVLCEGPSNWSGGGDSVIAGTSHEQLRAGDHGEKLSGRKVEIGSRLATAMGAARQGVKSSADGVQMTGRTTADQIVVFKGTPSLQGQIVPVRVNAAHGMTIFAELEISAIVV